MKILGIIFLVFAGGMVGTAFWRRSLEHIKFLEEYISLILEIKTEIKYTRKTLFQILKGYGSGKFLSPVIDKCVEFSRTCSFETAWQKAFSRLSKNYFLSSEEENLVKNFALKLGGSDAVSQENYCDYNISLMKPFLETALKNKAKNKNLPIILGFCISLIVSIVLI